MDLIEYLQSYKKGQPLMRKRGKKKPARPRRARGYGQRSSKYNSSNNESFNSNTEKLLTAVLAAVTKSNTPSVESLTQGKEFLERDRQIYSQVGVGQREFLGSVKQPVSSSTIGTQVTGFDIDRIEQQKALLFNTEQDLDMRVENILEKQRELLKHINSIETINPEEATRIRKENLILKEEVLSQSLELQEMLNDSEDLNDFRGLVGKQNKMIQDTTVGFASIDNELSRRQAEEIENLQKSTKAMIRETRNLVEQAYESGQRGFQAEVDRDRNERIQNLETALEREQELTGELAGSLKTFVDISKEQEQSGVLGVLGRDVLAGVRQDISTDEGMRQQIRIRTEQRIMEDKLKKKEKKEKKLKGRLKDTQRFYEGQEQEIIDMREQIETDSELKGKLVNITKDLRDIVKQQQTRTKAQEQTITRGLGREIVGRKKQQTKELEFSSKLIETNTGQIESMKQTNELLRKLDKAEQQKLNSQAQLRGLKQYADSLNDQLIANGEKGATAQQQFFDKKIEDLENNLAMEKEFTTDMKLKLEKSEEKEQVLRQQLREFEDEVDRQASRELERVVSGLSDI